MDFNHSINSGYGFGVSANKVSRQLRQLADEIDNGDTIVTDVDIHTAFSNEEFKEVTLAVTYNLKEA